MAPKRQRKSKANGHSPADGPLERARYEEMLPCKIEAADVELRAGELAKVIREREEMLERKRESNAKYREKIAFYDERLKELAESVEGRTERRSVECIEYLLPRTNEIQVVRQDTGEVVPSLTRTADPADLQEGLFDPPAQGEASEQSAAPDAG